MTNYAGDQTKVYIMGTDVPNNPGLPASLGQKTAAGSTSVIPAFGIPAELKRPVAGIEQYYYGINQANSTMSQSSASPSFGVPLYYSWAKSLEIIVSQAGETVAPTGLMLVVQEYEPVTATWSIFICHPADNLVTGTNNFPVDVTPGDATPQTIKKWQLTQFSGLLRFGLYCTTRATGGATYVIVKARG